MIGGNIFRSHYGDVMVGIIDCRPHQVCRTRINTKIVMIGNLFMEYAGNQAACRSQKPPAKLRIYGHVIHVLRDKHFFVCSSHSLANGANIGAG